MGGSASDKSSTIDFVDFKKTVSIAHGFELLSYDAVSLFTDVPINLAVEMVRRRLEQDSDTLDELGSQVDVIISLLQFFLSYTYLGYNGNTTNKFM